MNNVPGDVPTGRSKPWGTGQAIFAAKDLLHEPFAVINADDYYGKEAFRQLHDWLLLNHEDSTIAMAGFILKNTLSDNGGVTRGVCKVAEGHTHIINVVETSNIVKSMDSFGIISAEVDGVKLEPESSESRVPASDSDRRHAPGEEVYGKGAGDKGQVVWRHV